MKKLFMSLVAVAVMSSAAFAGEKASVKTTAETTMETKTITNTLNSNVRPSVTEIKDANGNVQRCRLTMRIYNVDGDLIRTDVLTWNCYGANDLYYSNCNEYFEATIAKYNQYYGNPNR